MRAKRCRHVWIYREPSYGVGRCRHRRCVKCERREFLGYGDMTNRWVWSEGSN